jgi:hypothetical protein
VRTYAAVVSFVLLGAVLSPLARDPSDDGFPLSTYPMFAYARPTTQTIDYAIGETRSGQRRTLDLAVIGTGEVLQARVMLERAVAAGAEDRARLCAAIAARVAIDSELADVATVRLVTGTHDAVEYLVHDRIGPEGERARCAVTR